MMAAIAKMPSRTGLGELIFQTFETRAWPWWLLTLLVIAAKISIKTDAGLFSSLGDTDDATRLVQVRELMTSAPWFDPTTMRMGGNSGMLSHWSRLIDLPLAAMIGGFGLVMQPESAEVLTRALWPILVLAPVLWVLYRSVAATGGELAGRFALLLAISCPAGLYQFIPGRIDHHNAMIAAIASAALLVWAHPQRSDVWQIAAGLMALALAIGYEALAPAAALGIFVAVWGLLDCRVAHAAQTFVVTLATSLALAFGVTIPPSRWMDIRCDALSLNMVVLIAFGAAGLAVALGRGRDWSLLRRVFVAGAATVAGLAAFGMLEPKCFAGPLGQLPQSLNAIWLDDIEENRSIFMDLLHGDIKLSLGLITFFALALAAQARRTLAQRAPADAVLLAVAGTFSALACWQYKYVPYASLVAIAPLAVAISNLGGWGKIPPSTLRLVAALVVGQGFIPAVLNAIETVTVRPSASIQSAGIQQVYENPSACFQSAAVRDLADLPPSLIAADMDLGPYIVALTHHRVLAAPYHRIANAILTNHEIFTSRDDIATATLLTRESIDYVVSCRAQDDPVVTLSAWTGTLRAKLAGQAPPAFLVPIAPSNPQSLFRVWRFDRSSFNQHDTRIIQP